VLPRIFGTDDPVTRPGP